MRFGLAWRALRHRRGQSVVLGLLAGIVVAACVSGPLYERAVEQASLRAALDGAPVSARGLTVNTSQVPDAGTYRSQVGDAAGLFDTPEYGSQVSVQFLREGPALFTRLVSRSGMCTHLRLVAGRCPDLAGEALVSQRLAQAAGLHLGDTYRLVPGS